MLDVSPPYLYFLLIEGTLIFDRVNLALNTSYIFVAQGGQLTVGTELEPFMQEAVITLHGNPVSQELPTVRHLPRAARHAPFAIRHSPLATRQPTRCCTRSPRTRVLMS